MIKLDTEIKSNGTTHSCEACIHRIYCKKTEVSLIQNAGNHGNRTLSLHGQKSVIYVPANCPVRKKYNPSFRFSKISDKVEVVNLNE